MKRFSLAILALVVATGAQAASEKVEMNLVTSQGVGQSIGSVTITETDKGLEFSPDLKALPPGEHGFHIHAKGSCQPATKDGKASAAESAGGHLDPQNTGKHEGPEGDVYKRQIYHQCQECAQQCRHHWRPQTRQRPIGHVFARQSPAPRVHAPVFHRESAK